MKLQQTWFGDTGGYAHLPPSANHPLKAPRGPRISLSVSTVLSPVIRPILSGHPVVLTKLPGQMLHERTDVVVDRHGPFLVIYPVSVHYVVSPSILYKSQMDCRLGSPLLCILAIGSPPDLSGFCFDIL